MQRSAATPVRPAKGLSAIRNGIEGTWLVALGLVPLAIVHETWMLDYIQVPKVFVLRSAALLLVSLLLIEWALDVGGARRPGAAEQAQGLASLRDQLTAHHARLVYYAAGAVLLANLVSVAFSPVPAIGVWGEIPGKDTNALFSVASFLVIFAVLATHLKSGDQLRRVLWTLTATASIVGLYGIGQHFGIDWALSDPEPVRRASLSFGNPIFSASYLLMTLPLTMALVLTWRDKLPPAAHVGVGGALVALQLAAIVFTLSRGPWVGGIAGAVVFFVALGWVLGVRNLGRPAAMAAVAAVAIVAITALPVGGDDSSGGGGGVGISVPSTGDLAVQRFVSIAPAVSGGVNQRAQIWRESADIFLTVPWVDADPYPEIPGLSVRQLRRFVGYGPDMFGSVYNLAGEANRPGHGHNFIVHTAIELGLLGVLAYAGLIVSLVIALGRMLRAARNRETPVWFTYVLVGLSGAIASRVIEQLTGKAQTSDLLLSWALAGLIVAMAVMAPSEEPEGATSTRSARAARNRRNARSGTASLQPVAIIAAVLVSVAAVALWWQAVVSEVRAEVAIADAQAAVAAGDSRHAAAALLSAAEHSANPVSRLALADGFINQQRIEPNPDDRTALLDAAQEHASAILKRNPFDDLAWSTLSRIDNQRESLSPTEASDAVRRSAAFVDLYPGFWEPKVRMATILVRIGRYEKALDLTQQAKDQGADRNPSYFYITAVAQRALGRGEDAKAAIAQLSEISTGVAAQMLKDYRALEDEIVLAE